MHLNSRRCIEVQTTQPQSRLIRLPEVESRTGLKKSTIYAAMKAGTFPKSIVMGARLVAWPQAQIDGWIADRIDADAPHRSAPTRTAKSEARV